MHFHISSSFNWFITFYSRFWIQFGNFIVWCCDFISVWFITFYSRFRIQFGIFIVRCFDFISVWVLFTHCPKLSLSAACHSYPRIKLRLIGDFRVHLDKLMTSSFSALVSIPSFVLSLHPNHASL